MLTLFCQGYWGEEQEGISRLSSASQASKWGCRPKAVVYGLGNILNLHEVEQRTRGACFFMKNRKQSPCLACLVPGVRRDYQSKPQPNRHILKAGLLRILVHNPAVLKGLQPGRRQLWQATAIR